MCAGGWPVHDPARPGAHQPEHPPALVQPEDGIGPPTDRWPRRVPYVVTVAGDPAQSFGPFPTVLAAVDFAGSRDYVLSGLYPPGDDDPPPPPPPVTIVGDGC